jgi:hypothetical protein
MCVRVVAGLSKVDGLDPKPENRVFAGKFASVPIMLRKQPPSPSRPRLSARSQRLSELASAVCAID